MKKIDILIPDFSDLGAQRVAINVANFLKKKHEVHFVVFEETGPFKSYLNPEIEIIILNKKISNIPKIRVFLRMQAYAKYIKMNRTELAISFSPITNFVILWGKFKNRKLKTIIQEHAFPTLFLKDRENISLLGEFFYKHLFVKFYNLSNIFLTSTKEIRDEFIKNFGIKNNLDFFKVVRNPLDIENIITLANENVEDFLFKSETKYLIGAGRLAEQKNFIRLIDVFILVKKQEKNTELIILGQGPLEIQLKKYAEEKGVKQYVHFLGFKKNPDKYISRADCFCLTSNWEALPQILAETMISKTIIVANDCHAGPTEMIENEKTGLLIPYKNISLFAEKIIWIFKNPEVKKQIEENAFQFAFKEYSLEKCEEKYNEIINYLNTQGEK